MLFNDESYQRGIDPYHGALIIITLEQGIKKRINRLKKRYERFNNLCEVKVLPDDAPLSYAELMQYDEICTIEADEYAEEEKGQEQEQEKVEITINSVLGELYDD